MAENLCKTCRWAKDKWHESCFCTYYGYIVSHGKSDCWGYEIRKEDENATVDDHREPDKRA